MRVIYSGKFKTSAYKMLVGRLTLAMVALSLSTLVSSPESLAQGVNDSLAPIMDSTESDPAGAQLMFMCIGLLVTLVMTIFGGTMYYMLRSKKKAGAQNVTAAANDESE